MTGQPAVCALSARPPATSDGMAPLQNAHKHSLYRVPARLWPTRAGPRTHIALCNCGSHQKILLPLMLTAIKIQSDLGYRRPALQVSKVIVFRSVNLVPEV